MIPCLHLLATCREWSDPNDNVRALETELGDLLTKHFASPFRAQFLDSRGRNPPPSDSSRNSLRNDLVSSLSLYQYPRPEQGVLIKDSEYETERSITKTRKHLTITFISLLFRVALKSCTRDTLSQRRVEGPWLESLFIQVTESAAELIPHCSPNKADKVYARLVKWMLRQSRDCELSLSLTTVRSALDIASGLFAEDTDAIDWDIISLCLLIDANVFTMPTSSPSRYQKYGYRSPNEYLTRLLSRVTTSQCRPIKDDVSHQKKLSKVILPLCDAFSNARDLPGFLGHWREQLDIIQGSRIERLAMEVSNPGSFGLSIWEEDILTQHVANLVDSSLTPGQIDQILITAVSEVSSSISSATKDDPVSLCGLVVIDCISVGVKKEDVLTKSAFTIQSISDIIEALLEESSTRVLDQRWRLWRIQATITERWTFSSKSSDSQRKAYSSVNNALELIRKTAIWGTEYQEMDFVETLHAFRFLLGVAEMRDESWDQVEFDPRQVAVTAIEKLLDTMEPFCHRTSYDFFETVKADVAEPQANETKSNNTNVGSLYIDCMSFIVFYPHLLR